MLLQARDLTRVYNTLRGPILALDGLSLEVHAGEYLAVCGRSGSGKSTLLGLLGGLSRPTRGAVHVDGCDLWSMLPRELSLFRANRCGFLFQSAGLLPSLRAIDNIALPALLAGKTQKESYDRARDLLDQVHLLDRFDAYPSTLSGGQQRRVALARALVNRPLLLLADEPTNNLDEASEREVLELLQELPAKMGTTLVVVTHQAQLARQASRVIYLREGKIAWSGHPNWQGREAFEPSLEAALPIPLPPPLSPSPLAASNISPLGTGLGSFLLGFLGWMLLAAGLLSGIDFLASRFQRQALSKISKVRNEAQELALQKLRADVEDVRTLPDGGHELTLYLMNSSSDQVIQVLGPQIRLFVQVDRNWQEIPSQNSGFDENRILSLSGKSLFKVRFRANLPRFEELLKGYMHLRVSNVMVVSDKENAGENLFQRSDNYYIYLRPPGISEAEVRKRNGWKEGAFVPLWIPMPSH